MPSCWKCIIHHLLMQHGCAQFISSCLVFKLLIMLVHRLTMSPFFSRLVTIRTYAARPWWVVWPPPARRTWKQRSGDAGVPSLLCRTLRRPHRLRSHRPCWARTTHQSSRTVTRALAFLWGALRKVSQELMSEQCPPGSWDIASHGARVLRVFFSVFALTYFKFIGEMTHRLTRSSTSQTTDVGSSHCNNNTLYKHAKMQFVRHK